VGSTADVPDTLALRDDAGGFAADSITLDGELNLRSTTGQGIAIDGVPVLTSPAGGSAYLQANMDAGTVLVSGAAVFGAGSYPAQTKSCTVPQSDTLATPAYGDSSVGNPACNAYCIAQGAVGGTVTATGSTSCSGGYCYYLTDVASCTFGRSPNEANCTSCSVSQTCTCTAGGTVLNGYVGVGTSTPASPLQVSGYLQVDLTSGQPAGSDCNAASQYGRMKLDPTTGKLWLCASGGWISK
jgi:hypothetical protein